MQKAKEQRRPLSGVNGEVRSKKDLTGPTLLEMSSALRKTLNAQYYLRQATASQRKAIPQGPFEAQGELKPHSKHGP